MGKTKNNTQMSITGKWHGCHLKTETSFCTPSDGGSDYLFRSRPPNTQLNLYAREIGKSKLLAIKTILRGLRLF